MGVYKVLLAGDLHKKHKDVSTIKGYVRYCDKVQESIMDTIREQGITHFVSLGDWYDKGYVEDISAALADTAYESRMSELLNKNFFGVIGNHIQLGLDSNPELFLIQPHDKFKTRKAVPRKEQILRTPTSFMVGTVQFSLAHNIPGSDSVLDYEIYRRPETSYHVAILHDPKFLPHERLVEAGIPYGRSINSHIDQVLAGVDLAILGDIHKPLGMITTNGGTPIYVPGSLTNTNVAMDSRHSEIDMPMFVIDTSKTPNEFSLKFHKFKLPLNIVTFSAVEKELLNTSRIKALRGKNKEELYENNERVEIDTLVSDNAVSMTFSDFMRIHGYKDSDKDMVRSVLREPENVLALMELHVKSNHLEDI